MLRLTLLVAVFAGLTAALLVGCAQDADNENGGQTAAATNANAETDAEIEEALAALSPEDRKLAEQQKICPVGKQPLGSMGTPIKVEVEGRTVFVCCEGCIDSLKENPDKYLQNL